MYFPVLRTWIRDPVPFFEPWIGFFWILDPKTHSFESLLTIFWLESSIILCKLAQINIILNFVIFVASKKSRTTNFFSPLSFVAVPRRLFIPALQ